MRRLWTEDEIATLLRMRQTFYIEDIANELGRTPASIKGKALGQRMKLII